MELNSQSRSFRLPVAVLDTVAEQLADVDFTLPDYCPDVEKILKCSLIPKIQSKSVSGGQLQVDGYCVVNVLYVESGGKTIRCCEQSVNFSQSFAVRDASADCVVLTSTKAEYINCRALSPRRLVIHGAFSLYAKVLSPQVTDIFSPGDEPLEVNTKNISCANLKAFCQEQFTVSEELSAADKPPVEAVLYSSVNAAVNELKAVTGKLMLSGELSLKMLYLCNVESGETAKLEYAVPFSQIIDCEGIDEDTVNLISCEVMSYDVRLKNDMLSDKPAIALDVKLCVTEEGYDTQDEQIVTDAYSVGFASAPKFVGLKSVAQTVPLAEAFIEKTTATVEGGKISKVLDIFADNVSVNGEVKDSQLNAGGKINLCILALDDEGVPVMIERTCEYSHPLSAASDCNDLVFPSAHAASVSYRLSDDRSVEIRCELKISGGAVKKESNRAVSDVEIFEDKPIKAESCALTLYFSDEGESLWEIAKAHNTRLDALLKENGVQSVDEAVPRMLLIPEI